MQRYFSLSKENILLSNDDIHHITHVMRGKKGDQVEVIKDSLIYVCEIVSTSPFILKEVSIKEDNNELNKDITLFYVLSKGDKNDLVIQKCTEIGVKNIVLLNSKRSVIKLDQKDFEKKKERYIKIAKEASEQCKRNIIPNIYGLYNITSIPSELLCDINLVGYELENGKTNKTMDFFQDFKKNKQSISILIGPEGGISEDEISSLISQGFNIVSLGKRILRTETAAIYALSVISFLLENDNG